MSYAGLRQTAVTLLREFGRPLIRERSTRVIDGVEGEARITTQRETVTAVVVGIRQAYTEGPFGGLIQSGDQMALCASELRVGDALLDGRKWQVVAVEEVHPGDTAIMYKALVRR